MFELLGALAATISAASGGGEAQRQPISLLVEPATDRGIRVQVVGASSSTYEASFLLEVTSNGNRSVHQGSATLQGGAPVVLSSVNLGNVSLGQWQARLSVRPRQAQPYEIVRTEF